MISQRTANLVFVAFNLVACAYFGWVAQGFETSGLLASSGLPSKFFPQLMLGLMAICAVIVGYQYLLNGSVVGEDEGNVFVGSAAARQGILMLGVTVLCYAIWRTYGFVPMAVLLGPLSLLAMGVRNPVIYGVVLALTAIVTAVFTYGLGIQLV